MPSAPGSSSDKTVVTNPWEDPLTVYLTDEEVEKFARTMPLRKMILGTK